MRHIQLRQQILRHQETLQRQHRRSHDLFQPRASVCVRQQCESAQRGTYQARAFGCSALFLISTVRVVYTHTCVSPHLAIISILPLPLAARCTCATPDCAPANVAAHLQSMALTEHCCQATMVCTVRAGIFETRRARPLVCLLLRLVRRVTCAFVLYTHTVPSTTSRLSGQI